MHRIVLMAALLAWSCRGDRPDLPDPGPRELAQVAPDAPRETTLEAAPGTDPTLEPGPDMVPDASPEEGAREDLEPRPDPTRDTDPDPVVDSLPDPIPEGPPDPVLDDTRKPEPQELPDSEADLLPDLTLDTPVDPGDPGPALVLSLPPDGFRTVVDLPVRFAGTTTCRNATITFTADGRYPFGTLTGVSGPFQYPYAFHNPGIDRRIDVLATGEGDCTGSVTRHLTVQPPFAVTHETRTDSAGSPFTVHIARLPTGDPATRLVVTGGTTPHTVRWFATSGGVSGVAAAVNGGYFATGTGPVSYAKGSLGYESPSGNVKGPRACLAWDRDGRTARVVLSMGRAWQNGAWGPGLFPDDSDVVCGGPRLLEDGQDVTETHLVSEHFESSGIAPDSPLPRTAACVTTDGSVLLVAAQHDTVKARGFTLKGLAAYLRGLGCRDALNLDGGGSTAFWSLDGYAPGTEDRPVYHAILLALQ